MEFCHQCVPDGVRELCDCCFKGCSSLCRVTFGPSSSLERIGVSCFERTKVKEFAVPDSVRELCKSCFYECWSLRRVTFSPSSTLERISDYCLGGSGRVGFETPPSVRHIGRSIFSVRSQLFVETMSGNFHVTLKCERTDKIADLKVKIHDQSGIPPHQQVLIFKGRHLEDSKTLLTYHIEPGSKLYLGLRVVREVGRRYAPSFHYSRAFSSSQQ